MKSLLIGLIFTTSIIYAQNKASQQIDVVRSQYGVWCELVNLDVLYPEIVVQKAWVETHCGLLGVGYTKNNIFGFRITKEYMCFESVRDCILYYKEWQDRNYPAHLEEYHKFSMCDYWCFIQSMGWKTGKPYSKAERKYTNYCKKVKLNF